VWTTLTLYIRPHESLHVLECTTSSQVNWERFPRKAWFFRTSSFVLALSVEGFATFAHFHEKRPDDLAETCMIPISGSMHSSNFMKALAFALKASVSAKAKAGHKN
jgi:hypothetical protein